VRIPSALVFAFVLGACAAPRGGPHYATPAAAPPLPYGFAPVAAEAAAPAPSGGAMQFRFQVGDELAVAVWKEPELSTQQRIMADGTVSPPLLRTIPVVGLSVDDVRVRLEREYAEFLKEPRVSVRVVAIHSDRVFVVGEVKNPQAVPLAGPTTVVQAISMAGGFVEEAAQKNGVRVVRAGPDGRPQAHIVNVANVLGGFEPDVAVRRGDIVVVPTRGVTQWSRTAGQALGPISSIIGTAGGVALIYDVVKDN
jgi:polysaccharide biosynthesis/export protein